MCYIHATGVCIIATGWFNYHKLSIPHKLPCLEGALILYYQVEIYRAKKEARHLMVRAGQMGGAHYTPGRLEKRWGSLLEHGQVSM